MLSSQTWIIWAVSLKSERAQRFWFKPAALCLQSSCRRPACLIFQVYCCFCNMLCPRVLSFHACCVRHFGFCCTPPRGLELYQRSTCSLAESYVLYRCYLILKTPLDSWDAMHYTSTNVILKKPLDSWDATCYTVQVLCHSLLKKPLDSPWTLGTLRVIEVLQYVILKKPLDSWAERLWVTGAI